MTADPLSLLTGEQRETIHVALDAVFGSEWVDSIAFVEGGASGAFPFRIGVGARRYLLRLEGTASPLRNLHQYKSMRIASAEGIAPAIHHIDEANRVAVMDFVEERPLSGYPGGAEGLSNAVGTLLGRVRDMPFFSRFVEYPEMVDRLWQWVCQTEVLAPDVLAPCTERLAQLCKTYAWNATECVSSHNLRSDREHTKEEIIPLTENHFV